MLTQCPGCQTVFRVTSTILRAAHGQVRCGRCNLQFDAIDQLLEADEPDIAATQTALKALDPGEAPLDQAAPDTPGDADDEHTYGGTAVAHEDIVLEGNRIEISGVYPGVNRDDEDQLSHTHTIIEELDLGQDEWQAALSDAAAGHPDELADAELEDVEEAISETSLMGALTSLDESMAANEAEIEHDAATNAVSRDSIRTVSSPSLTQMNPWLALRQNGPEEEVLRTSPQQPRRWPWAFASMVLGLALVAQVLHHYRQQLARHPGYGPSLARLYAALGQPLTPQWDLSAYGIKQWGMVSDPQLPGTLRVRASVTNSAHFAQPYPLLQISLEDRFGSKVGSRAFKPGEYLGNAAQAARLLAAGESANIDLAIVDPGETAVGFQFDTCLQSDAGLRCTHASGS